MNPRDRFLYVQTRLGRDLNRWLAEQKASGRTLRTIGADLTAATNVPVSREAVRRWLDWLDRNAA